ncbi:MAG: outer membrane beta-barrel protein [Alphaproteobacteria bacterium]|jgi:hypothetical protein|nr:outer membrane beta-barrel protein [Alphaproteobacteria bacterium]
MFIRFSYGAVALFATTALTQDLTAYAQDADPAETTQQAEEDRVLGPVVVRGQFIPDEKRDTSEVASLVDSEDFAVRGDSDVAAALRRATGVSLDTGGKFVFVRGLNERYTNSMLNGSVIPSPEPLRKVAPLDLFPTSVLESTLVQKTFSPDMSAEFGGGVLDIRTRAVPDRNFFEIGVSGGGDTETAFEDGFLHDGSDTDYFGYDDGARDLPAGLGAALANGTFNSFDVDGNAISQALTDDPGLLVVQEGVVGPDFGIDASLGRRLDVNDALSVGFLGALSYSNEWSTKDGVQGIGEAALTAGEPGGTVNTLSRFERRSTTNEIGVNGLASVGFDILDNHELKFLAFGTRSTDKETEVREGFTNDEDVRNEDLEWVERQLWTTQAQGSHFFDALLGLEIDWRASYSQADRDAPFSVRNSYERGADDNFVLRNRSGIEFSDLEDETTDWGFDGLLPLMLGEREFNVKFGYAYTEKDRETQNDFLVLQSVGADAQGLRVDAAYQQILSDGFSRLQNTRSTQSPAFYIATQEVDAGYVGIDAQLTDFVRLALGGRYEDFIQVIETRTASNTPGVITPPLEDDQFFPAATVTWTLPGVLEDWQLRAGYSETVNRPQFREVGPSRFTNTETNEQFLGNPFLESTDITNYDARLEWYFGRDEFLTLGVFAKELDNPIEAFNVGSGESRLVTFVNIDSADVTGAEFEFQKAIPLDEWTGWDWLDSKDFRVTTNYTFTDSEISASSDATFLDQRAAGELAGFVGDVAQTTLVTLETDSNGQTVLVPAGGSADVNGIDAVVSRPVDFRAGRQLQGQSEHLFNFQFGYSDNDARSDLNFLVNFQSERIRSVESFTSDSPAILERPPVSVDVVYKKQFDFYEGEYEFGLKVQNIFGDGYEAVQESGGASIDVDTYDLGPSASVSLKRRF